MATEAPNLMVTPSGTDEVSQRVAATLNDVHAAFSKSSDEGVRELREVSATLRGHADNVVAADQDFAG
jgi:hypothetical protein